MLVKVKQKGFDNQKFFKRIIFNLLISTLLLLVSLLIGMIGYKYYLNLSWVDALVNASMTLTGMGPVDKATTDGGKIFSSIYAIYSGVAFLTSVACLAGPIFHRILHQFHLDLEDAN